MLVLVFSLFFRKSYDPNKDRPLTQAEQDALIEEWTPEPLCPPLSEAQKEVEFVVVESGTGATVQVAGKDTINMASFNFLGLAGTPETKEIAAAAIDKYGVGSCGPRGFYGTIDVHLDFEKVMAEFVGTSDSILYSDGMALVASVIPAFAKRGDLVIYDEGISYGAKQGVSLSRSNVLTFKHNDMSELENILKEQKAKMRPNDKLIRRFIVVEGISAYYGDLAPLAKLVELKKKYKYRLLLDDSLAVGVLGNTGRGSPEHWNVPINDIDVYCVTADTALATTGGFCMGNSEVVVDHQRLSGAGYCFSASSPPFASAVGINSIRTIEKHPERCAEVRAKATMFRRALKSIEGLEILGDEFSPVIQIRRKLSDDHKEQQYFRRVCKQLLAEGVLVECPSYIPLEKKPPRPSIRMIVTSLHSEAQLQQVAKLVKKVLQEAL